MTAAMHFEPAALASFFLSAAPPKLAPATISAAASSSGLPTVDGLQETRRQPESPKRQSVSLLRRALFERTSERLMRSARFAPLRTEGFAPLDRPPFHWPTFVSGISMSVAAR